MGIFTGAMPALRGTSFARLDSEPELGPRLRTHEKRPLVPLFPRKSVETELSALF